MTVGGTLYTDNTQATTNGGSGVEVIFSANGSEVYRIPVDKSGNFYTNRTLDFPVSVSLSNGNTMTATVAAGNCSSSSCHGTNSTQGSVW